MCGAIASSLMFAFSNGEGAGKRLRALFLAHAGRVLMYVAAGAAVGAFGSAIDGAVDRAQEECRRQEFSPAFLAIQVNVKQVAGIKLRFIPGATIRNDPERVEHLAVGVLRR